MGVTMTSIQQKEEQFPTPHKSQVSAVASPLVLVVDEGELCNGDRVLVP